jgi:2-dehydropantoate 2-reductase
MRVLVYGAGVQGAYLAHVLIRGNNDVTVLARGKRAEELKNDGIVLRHYLQCRTTVDKVKIINELRSDDVYDMIFVTMKYTDFPDVLPILAQNGSENIILVGNNAAATEMEAYLETHSETKKNIAFGFQISGGKRDEKRTVVVRFNSGEMIIGSLGRDVPFQDILEKLFANTGYKITYEGNIDAWLKNHMIMIVPMNIAAYIKDFDFKAVARDNQGLRRMVAAIDESYEVLKDLGYEIIPAKQADFMKQHKHLSFLFYKLYHYTPLANQINGSFKEVKGLYDYFNKMKATSEVSTPNFDVLVRKSDEKLACESMQ